MKRTVEINKSLLGPELFNALEEICGSDKQQLEEMVTEAVNALSAIKYLQPQYEIAGETNNGWYDEDEFLF